ncbi:putative reverse transcriptase domain-containing protein [Tanacetum coccineum]
MAEYSQKWHNGTSRLRSTKIFDGLTAIQAQLNNLEREIKKVNEKVYAAQVGCEQCKGPYYTKDCPLKEEGKTLEEAYYTQFGGPFQGGGYKVAALGFYQRNNANPSYQDEGNLSRYYRKEDLEVYLALLKQTREIKSSQFQLLLKLIHTRYAVLDLPDTRLNGYYCGEKKGSYGPQFSEAYSEASHINNSIPRKEKDLGSFTLPCFINNVCFDNALVDLGASINVMPLSSYLNLGLGELAHTKLTVELADRTMKYPKGIAENILVGIGKFTFPIDFIILVMPEDIKVPLILERPFFINKEGTTAKFEEKGNGRIYHTRLMGETLVLNRSLYPFLEDYIELNNLNEPFELRRNQGDDLMPTIEEGEVIKEFRTRDDELDAEIDDYPSYCDYDKKIIIDCAHNLKFSCMIGFEFTHVNFFPLLYVNVMSKKFHNSIMKDKMVYKGNNVVGALMNVPIFVGTFSIMTDFAVLENIDDYRDEGMGDVIFGEPFLREVGIKTKRFEGIITVYNGDDEVTYQMVRSHPRFKHHTNEQCNKIPPLLKVSEEDKMNEISHSYQKLKGFYKGVFNLGPDYIRDAKMKEWLTRGHISVHEME